MLTREHRLKKFQNVYQEGRKVRGRYLALQYIKKPDGVTRFGFAVARKIKTKVEKNRLKRQLRNICRTHMKENKDGLDIVVNIFSVAAEASYGELERDFLMTSRRAGLLRQSAMEQN
ncbi:MAG: ribonuclease P protein component [Thermacetogeniaceae bacterium]|jgi:ribonuclease P protein component